MGEICSRLAHAGANKQSCEEELSTALRPHTANADVLPKHLFKNSTPQPHTCTQTHTKFSPPPPPQNTGYLGFSLRGCSAGTVLYAGEIIGKIVQDSTLEFQTGGVYSVCYSQDNTTWYEQTGFSPNPTVTVPGVLGSPLLSLFIGRGWRVCPLIACAIARGM